jgi:hypothetical protein
MNNWTGNYSSAIREFAFLLRVDGDIDTYTKRWNIEGTQKAKRKRDWIEVEIGVPESWWRQNEGRDHKMLLAGAIEAGLLSMIELLRRNHHAVRAEALVSDRQKIKSEYLPASTPDTAEAKETNQSMRKAEEIVSRYNGTLAALSKQKHPF